MSKGKIDYKEFKIFADKIQKFTDTDASKFAKECAKELSQRLLAEVVLRTPVGDYSGNDYTCNARKGGDSRTHKGNKVTGKQGGTLRRGWSIKSISKKGNIFEIEIINPVEYSSYVESGHRTKNGGWVEGHFMLKISCDEVAQTTPKILEVKLNKMLKEVFKC